MDVKTLYPSIPRQQGMEACREALDKRTDKSITTEATMKMIQTVLENNIFSFNGKDYLQQTGTAIGSRLGRNYACTYMGKWEQELLLKAPVKPRMYVRYVDDIFGLWSGTEDELREFHTVANNIDNNIKVDLRLSDKEIEFLDVLVRCNNNKLETTIYHKPTDQHIYVHSTSEHPKTTKNAIPYGLGIRAKRICSSPAEYESNKAKIIRNLEQRGYPIKSTKKVLEKVDNLTRHSLLQYKTRKCNSRVPLTITYSRRLPNIQNILHSRIGILHRSQRMKDIFPQAPITAFRRDENLQDILVHKKHNKIIQRPGSNKCGKKCAICGYITKETEFNANQKDFKFNQNVTCKTTNVIYAIFCNKCKTIVYVGETGTTLYERFQNHLSAIKKKTPSPIPDHFNSGDHTVNNLEIVCVEKNRDRDIHLRKIRETFWIHKLNTLHPHGLNRNTGIGDGIRKEK